MLSVKGIFHNGVAEPAASVEGRDGEPVIITFLAEKNAKALPSSDDAEWDSLFKLLDACRIDTGIPDLAHEHDHYLHGKPKKG